MLLRQPLDGHPQPPLLFCDTLPDCSVISRLSSKSNHSPLSVAHFYAFAIPLGKYPIYFAHSYVASFAGRFLDFVRARLFDLSCSCPLVRASLRILLYSGIPHSSMIYLCAKCFLPHILVQLLPGYLQIDSLGGIDAKSSMGRPGGSLSLPAGPRFASGPTFIIALLVFSQVYNRVISGMEQLLAYPFPFPVMGLTELDSNYSNGRRPSVLTAFQFFLVHPITSNVSNINYCRTARSDIE